ncbi:uncharacterized protein LOC128241794 [Mya arenaria]|uniref:uncharacterized protein LOC128241766 n=1 Tax=Mya arenaria TaxID=6604 RepID=UPI0022E85C8B|nr:uncharacterized protein LOC128241766 [Mya arenaria]XP_052814838.1 uncharacterized protein LOC128241794 [Mya arenaria]
MVHLTQFAGLIIGLCLLQIILGQRNSIDFGVGRGRGGGIRGDIGWTRRGRRGSRSRIGGSLDTNGNWGISAGFSWRRRRALRFDQDTESFHVKLMADPCAFDFYDQDKDGSISTVEMWSVFGNTTEANMLFYALNKGIVDDTISKDEFVTLAPILIDDCFQNRFNSARNGQ